MQKSFIKEDKRLLMHIFPMFPTGFEDYEEPPRNEDKEEKKMIDCRQ